MTPHARARLHALCFVNPRPWSAAEFADLVRQVGVITVDVPAGFVMGRTATEDAELLTLAVHPAHRGVGIGRRLVSAFESQAAAQSASRIFLEVAEDNVAARRLYTAAGYYEVGRRDGYFRQTDGPAVDALVMRRDLPGSAPGTPG